MAAVTTIIAGAALGTMAYSANRQRKASKDAAAANDRAVASQERQFAIQRKQADIANARQVRQAVRQARLARAQVINAGAGSGTLGSSGVQGGASSISAQMGSNLSFFSSMHSLNNQAIAEQVIQGRTQGDSFRAQAAGQRAAAVGQLAGTIFSGAGGFKTIFGKTA
jgi:hypothetical protein